MFYDKELFIIRDGDELLLIQGDDTITCKASYSTDFKTLTLRDLNDNVVLKKVVTDDDLVLYDCEVVRCECFDDEGDLFD